MYTNTHNNELLLGFASAIHYLEHEFADITDTIEPNHIIDLLKKELEQLIKDDQEGHLHLPD